MTKTKEIVVICEDKQQEAFIRRFLRRVGQRSSPDIIVAPEAGGSAEQFVREQYVKYLRDHRRFNSQGQGRIIVMIDGDGYGVEGREKGFVVACRQKSVPARKAKERACFLIPCREIETWFACLDGEEVDELEVKYPKLQRERECKRHVMELARMCESGKLRQPAPESLVAVCEEFRTRFY